MSFNVTLLKSPTEQDWMFCKTCTLNTVGKKSTVLPKEEWMVKLIESEHSPLRELTFAFKLEIPYYVSTHFVRHHVGVNHYISTQRTDRTGIDRAKEPQGTMVSHIITMNAQAFIHMAHARLCTQADVYTQSVMREMVSLALESNPEFKSVLVPRCAYRNGRCTEFYPCEHWKTYVK